MPLEIDPRGPRPSPQQLATGDAGSDPHRCPRKRTGKPHEWWHGPKWKIKYYNKKKAMT